jgi:hypothetical protein
MRKLIILSVLSVISANCQTVSSARIWNLSHSSLSVTFNSSTTFNYIRLRFGTSDCSTGTGAVVYPNGFNVGSVTSASANLAGLSPNTTYYVCPEISTNGTSWSSGFSVTATTLPLPAQHPLPPVHPHIPAELQQNYPDITQGTCWSNSQPGYCTVVSSCTNLTNDVNTAISHQNTSGTVVLLPANSDCVATQNNPVLDIHTTPPDVLTFDSTKVTNNTINLPNHGLSEGTAVMFDYGNDINGTYAEGLLGGVPYFVHVVDANDFQLYGTWQQYSASTQTGSNTITLTNINDGNGSNCGFQKMKPIQYICNVDVGSEVIGPGIPSGTTITAINYANSTVTLSNAATATQTNVTLTFSQNYVNSITAGTNIAQRFVVWPRTKLYWVIVRTQTPDTQFVAPGNRVTPEFSSVMPRLEQAYPTSYSAMEGSPIVQVDDCYPSCISSHLWFTGIYFNTQHPTYSSPVYFAHDNVIDFGPQQADNDIVFDRCIFTQDPDIRNSVRLYMEGNPKGFAFINNYVSNIVMPKVVYAPGTYRANPAAAFQSWGQTPTGSGTTLNIPAYSNIYYFAPNPLSLPSGLTITWTGTPTVTNPELDVWADMNNNIVVQAPQGLSVTAPSGVTVQYTTSSGSSSPNCSNSGNPLLPKDQYGNLGVLPLACVALNGSGQITALPQPMVDYSFANLREGAVFLYSPNPGGNAISASYVLVRNNYFSGSTVNMLFFDDPGGHQGGDFLITKNYFTNPTNLGPFELNYKVPSPYFYSNGYGYWPRQFIEFKGGQRIWVDGNVFNVYHKSGTRNPNPTLTNYTGAMTDIDITNNVYAHGTGAIDIAGGSVQDPTASIVYRERIHNNLLYDSNGWLYTDGAENDVLGVGGAFHDGINFEGTNRSTEDLLIDHNTILYTLGTESAIFSLASEEQPVEGMVLKDNILELDTGSEYNSQFFNAQPTLRSDCQTNTTGGAVFSSCAMVNSDFKNNLLVPGYLCASWPLSACSGSNANGQIPASTVNTILGSLASKNTVLADSSVNGTIATVGFYNPTLTTAVFNPNGTYGGVEPYYRLKDSSAYNKGATDGKQYGVNFDELEDRIGLTSVSSVSAITSSSAILSYSTSTYGASLGCTLDVSSSDPNVVSNFTRVNAPSGARNGSVGLSGLSTHTLYYYRFTCPGWSPIYGQFKTN